MSILEISEETLQIMSMEKSASISIKNRSANNLCLRVILTNPDQYQISKQSSLLEPNQEITLTLEIKINPSINHFNYKNNSLFILYTKPEIQVKQFMGQFEIGKCIDHIGLVQIPIRIHLELPVLGKEVEDMLTRFLKVSQVSSFTGIILKHSPYLQQLTSKMGKIQSIVKHESSIIVQYKESIPIVPNVVLNANKQKMIESVYVYGYPTSEDLRSLQEAKGLSFVKVDEIFIPSLITDFSLNDQILSCKSQTKLFLLNINNHKVVTFDHQNFRISDYPPYMCVVMEYKYLHFYENWSNPNSIKIKLKKLEVKCFCKTSNNLFAGGKNRSKIAFKQSTSRREILVYQNFKVVDSELAPSKKIRLDDSGEDVSMLLCQNPYILAYCRPVIYLVNAQKHQVVIKLQRDLQCGILLEGRYLKSLISFVGVTIEDRVLRINFDRMGGVYGVEIDETANKAFSVAQTKSGRVFLNERDRIFQFNPVMTEVINQWRPKEPQLGVIRKMKTNLTNQLMMLRNSDKTSTVQFYTFQ